MNTDIDKTKKLPKRIIWRDALRGLKVGEFFEAPQLKRPSISNQASLLKKEEGLEFKTNTISENIFKVIRTK